MVTAPPHHTPEWHSLHDGTDTACIYGHEYVEGNYRIAEDADGQYKVCLYCESFYMKKELPPKELPAVASRHYSTKSYLKRRHSLKKSTYDAILSEQNGVCSVCQALPPVNGRLSIDNRAGRIVALLCRRCLTAIRMLKNDASRAQGIAAYLMRTTDTHPEIPDAEICEPDMPADTQPTLAE